jgi:hypothetical protein
MSRLQFGAHQPVVEQLAKAICWFGSARLRQQVLEQVQQQRQALVLVQARQQVQEQAQQQRQALELVLVQARQQVQVLQQRVRAKVRPPLHQPLQSQFQRQRFHLPQHESR